MFKVSALHNDTHGAKFSVLLAHSRLNASLRQFLPRNANGMCSLSAVFAVAQCLCVCHVCVLYPDGGS